MVDDSSHDGGRYVVDGKELNELRRLVRVTGRMSSQRCEVVQPAGEDNRGNMREWVSESE